MKPSWKILFITTVMLMTSLIAGQANGLSPFATNQVTVKLVLGDNATLAGYTANNDEDIYHRNVVTYTAASDSTLPRPSKPGTSFVSWVYAQSSALVRVNKMPKTSGAVYYAYWLGDGSLATTLPSSSQPTSSSQSSSASVTTSSSTEPFVPFDLYLQAKTEQVDWTLNNPQIRLFYWNAPTPLSWPGVPMVDEGNGLYRYRFDTFTPTNLLFVRLNPTDPTQVWNQTIDLTYPSPENLFTLTSWDGGEEGKSTGSWSTYQGHQTSSETSSSEVTPSSSSLLESSIIQSSEPINSSSDMVSSSSLSSSSDSPSSELSSSSGESTSSLPPSSGNISSNESSLIHSSPVSSESVISSSSMDSSLSSSLPLSSEVVSSSSEQTLSSSLPSSSEIIESSSITSSSSTLVSSTSESSTTTPLTFDVYLKVNDSRADWSADNPSFELHYWGNAQSSNWTDTPVMTSLGNGLYHFVWFDYQPTHLLFLRKATDRSVIWNMTIDYAYPGDEALFTVTQWNSDQYCDDCSSPGTYKSTGEWSTYQA
ncbi:MAG: starch-binding protein [Bacilli bacterium]